ISWQRATSHPFLASMEPMMRRRVGLSSRTRTRRVAGSVLLLMIVIGQTPAVAASRPDRTGERTLRVAGSVARRRTTGHWGIATGEARGHGREAAGSREGLLPVVRRAFFDPAGVPVRTSCPLSTETVPRRGPGRPEAGIRARP